VSAAPKKTIRMNINDCGNKFDLFQQLMMVGLRLSDAPYFRIVGGLEETRDSAEDHISINGLQAEDGSGNCWNISGYYPTEVPNGKFATRRGGTFTGFINTRTRQGFIDITLY
jgi:hypothetical protein